MSEFVQNVVVRLSRFRLRYFIAYLNAVLDWNRSYSRLNIILLKTYFIYRGRTIWWENNAAQSAVNVFENSLAIWIVSCDLIGKNWKWTLIFFDSYPCERAKKLHDKANQIFGNLAEGSFRKSSGHDSFSDVEKYWHTFIASSVGSQNACKVSYD